MTTSVAGPIQITPEKIPDLLEAQILCLFTATISTICIFIAIFYQLWSSTHFWEYVPSLCFAITGFIGYAFVFGLIYKMVINVGSNFLLSWPLVIFVAILVNVVVFSIPGLGINSVATIVAELAVGGLGFLAYKTWRRKNAGIE